ncbi:hypothetical protein GRF59_18770 [Paenibacillus sp. HJL G12]|uniref:Uncharacterized protein n=1 Tax=Paenibacillus dendrobii TaxID=2691084 RepID=A0A7X3IN20_9BACL|nr:hypothetical protein [Paenibacillus dendrobii]MWV45660.1 hypothetical protein [Paenibacillus dendrobii]
MSQSPIRIIDGPDGVELLGAQRAIRLKTASYDDIVRVFSRVKPGIREMAWVDGVRAKLAGDSDMPHLLEPYELGSRIVLTKGACPRCLGLQYPVSGAVRSLLPAALLGRHWTGNRIVHLDEGGLVSIAVLPEVAHAACCPISKSALDRLEVEKRDESVLEQELVKDAIRYVNISFDRYWTLTADFGERIVRFDGPSKRRVLEDMYAYMLQNCYSYHSLSPGLTARAAYLLDINSHGLADGIEKEQGILETAKYPFWKSGPVSFPPWMKYQRIEGLMEVFSVEWKMRGILWRAFGEDPEDALFRLWNRMRDRKSEGLEACEGMYRHVSQNSDVGRRMLLRYEDGFSRKYGFALLGGGGDP